MLFPGRRKLQSKWYVQLVFEEGWVQPRRTCTEHSPCNPARRLFPLRITEPLWLKRHPRSSHPTMNLPSTWSLSQVPILTLPRAPTSLDGNRHSLTVHVLSPRDAAEAVSPRQGLAEQPDSLAWVLTTGSSSHTRSCNSIHGVRAATGHHIGNKGETATHILFARQMQTKMFCF